MKNIKVLDCTLRDGGYCNQWKFGKRNIEMVISSLVEAGISTVEYGYLDEKCKYDEDSTQVPSLEMISTMPGIEYVLMINYGSMGIEKIPICNTPIKGLRVAFHKKDMDKALIFCKGLQDKGYSVYVQPMATNGYNTEEYKVLLEKVNELKPMAFYIVDSFGSMYDLEVERYLQLADERLKADIALGFHGHDNSRLAFDNAKTIIKSCSRDTVYIDSSIMGMGRGAGNLSTEIIVEYFNKHYNSDYNIRPILKVIDEVINFFYLEKTWGYSPYLFITGLYQCHPNYAVYLLEEYRNF